MDIQTIIYNVTYIMVIIALGIFVVYIKSKLGDETFNKLIELIDTYVFSAEQTIKGENMGAVRKTEVMNNVLAQQPKGTDIADIDNLVESRVYLMNLEQKKAREQ